MRGLEGVGRWVMMMMMTMVQWRVCLARQYDGDELARGSGLELPGPPPSLGLRWRKKEISMGCWIGVVQ